MKVLFFNYIDADTGKVYQVWYDDPESLSTIYNWVVNKGFGGSEPYR